MFSADNGRLLKRANAALEKLLKKESKNRNYLSQSNFAALRSSLQSFIRKLNAKLAPKVQERDEFLDDLKLLKNYSRLSADQINRNIIISEKKLFTKYFNEKRHYKLDLMEKYYSSYFSVNVPDISASNEERERYRETLNSLSSSLEGAHSSLVSHILEKVKKSEEEYISSISRQMEEVLSNKFYEQLQKVEICNRLKLSAKNYLNKSSDLSSKQSESKVKEKSSKQRYQTADLGNIKQREFSNTESKKSASGKSEQMQNHSTQNKQHSAQGDKNNKKGNSYDKISEEILNKSNKDPNDRLSSQEPQNKSQNRYDTPENDKDDTSVSNQNNDYSTESPQSNKQASLTSGSGNGTNEVNNQQSSCEENNGSTDRNSEANQNQELTEKTNSFSTKNSTDNEQQFTESQSKSESSSQSSRSYGGSNCDPLQKSDSLNKRDQNSQLNNDSNLQSDSVEQQNTVNNDDNKNLGDLKNLEGEDLNSLIGTATENGGEELPNIQKSNENLDNYNSTGQFLAAKDQSQMKSDDVIDLPDDIDLNENIFSPDGSGSNSLTDNSTMQGSGTEQNDSVDLDNVKSLADMLNEMGIDSERMLDPFYDNFWPHQFWKIPKHKFGYDGNYNPSEDENDSLDTENDAASQDEPPQALDPDDELISELVDSILSNGSSNNRKNKNVGRNVGTLTDVGNDFVHYFGIIEHNKGVQKLIDRLGRCMGLDHSQEEKLKESSSSGSAHKSSQSNEYLSGLTLGNEISYLMPQELVKIYDPETESIFDINYLERNLMRFDFEGIVNADGEKGKIRSSPSHERGPVILCIDTSSSMQGIPESYAKALVMSIASKCISAQRNCFLINFSVHIEKLLVRSDSANAYALIQEFLRKSFNGGSDLDEALEECLKLMKNDPAFYRSDLLCITDGKVKYSDSLVELIQRRKKKEKNNFYELVVSTDYTDAYFYSESGASLMDPKHLFDIIFRLNRNGNILTEFRNGKIKIYN